MRAVVLLITFCTIALSAGFPPSYYKLPIKKQKIEFANLMSKMLKKSNENIIKEREFVIKFFSSPLFAQFQKDKSKELKKLVSMAKKYKIRLIFDKKSYLHKIDTIPISLGIAQAALESAWGKSRFVKEANNIFGHWTYGKYGLIPANREEGKTHKIRIFKSLQDSTDAYTLNLNRNRAYKMFRKKRAIAKDKNLKFKGIEAAKTMINYSEIKGKYVKIISNLILKNNLDKYDRF